MDDEHDAPVEGPPNDYDSAYDRRPSVGSRACGVVGCLLLLALVVGAATGAAYVGGLLEPLADRFLWAPHDVVREYFDAYRRDDRQRTDRFECEGVERLDPLAPFDRRSGNPYVDDEFPYPRPGGRLAIYYRLELRGPRAQAMVEREDEGWRICAFE